jgi:D-3-phosphoglycerate dehydrogenase
MCKQGVILVNTARGGLIDEKALQNCLLEGQVSFACLDVFEEEPYCGPLCSLNNVILTPHIGSYAKEARELMERKAVDNLLKGLHEVGVL